jgi:hypothetical protein
MKKSKFQIGQTVTVIDKGCRYPGYHEMAKIMRLTNWSPNGSMQNGGIATIVAVELHPDSSRKTYLYGVQLPCGEQEIIGEGGLELYADNCSSTIKISREILNSYWDAATTEQRGYINKHFQLDGTTTADAIKGLRDIACDKWRKIIMSNHPEVFPEDSKYFDLKGLRGDVNGVRLIRDGSCIFTIEEAKAAGFSGNGFIQIADAILGGEYKNRGFYLGDSCNWEFHETKCGGWVVVPTKKGK